MEPLSGGRGRVGAQLAACGATLRCGKRSTQGHVYHQRAGKRELQLAPRHPQGRFPQRGCPAQIALSPHKGIEKNGNGGLFPTGPLCAISWRLMITSTSVFISTIFSALDLLLPSPPPAFLSLSIFCLHRLLDKPAFPFGAV